MQFTVRSACNAFYRPGFRHAALPLLAAGSFLLPPVARAAGAVDADVAIIQQLENKASIAGPREQCFLYTELVSRMTELASRQLSIGDVDQAATTIKKISVYAERIQMGVADDAKKLKKAEILLRQTDHRLNDIMHASSGEDRGMVQNTLKRLQTVHTELLAVIFRH
ncbi:hypothetical protein [Terriglobus tenax]|uniref:hypothetical protein n=1 Tax=Terriglobus tenax TaxID=1111115 RepID=UPI0021DFCE08|nr:hypothetical protein [Terriglobus tenax]